MTSGRQLLARHLRDARRRYPRDRLMILFDIDGTVLDMHRLVQGVLVELDREDGSNRFAGVRLEDVPAGEDAVETLLEKSGLYHCETQRILERYYAHCWRPEMLHLTQAIFTPVYDLIQWLRHQPFTHVGLNTGRHSSARRETLQALQALGTAFGVWFSRDFLYMNPDGDGPLTGRRKVKGVRYFQDRGYRIVGVFDSEPRNVAAMAKAMSNNEIVFQRTEALLTKRDSDSAVGPDGEMDRLQPSSLVLAS